MIRMIESVTIPTAAISVARIMKARKLPERTAVSDVRASTCSQTTASAGEPAAARSAASARCETAASISIVAIVPRSPRPSCWSRRMTVLTSSRATSTSTRSPSGARAAPGRWIRFSADESDSSSASTFSDEVGGNDEAEVDHRRSLLRR